MRSKSENCIIKRDVIGWFKQYIRDETTRQRLERIGGTAHEAWLIVGGGSGDGLTNTAAVQQQLDKSKDQAQGQGEQGQGAAQTQKQEAPPPAPEEAEATKMSQEEIDKAAASDGKQDGQNGKDGQDKEEPHVQV